MEEGVAYAKLLESVMLHLEMSARSLAIVTRLKPQRYGALAHLDALSF